MREIQAKGSELPVLVDDEDFDLVSKYSWVVHGDGNWRYARTKAWDKANQKEVRIQMHRLILQPPASLMVDHINGNCLDNRRSNLRVATNSQNQANRQRLTRNTSGFRGVTWNKTSRKWQAGIKVGAKSFHLGLFVDPLEAALAYDKAAQEFFGEFATLNRPKRAA